jgi:hypothetical protein
LICDLWAAAASALSCEPIRASVKKMPVQEQILRELIACRACPALTKAVEAVAAGTGSDPSSLSYQQLLQTLQSLPLTDYSGSLETSCRALLDAMRAGEAQHEQIKALAADLCHDVSTTGLATC